MCEAANARELLTSVWKARQAVNHCMWEAASLQDRCQRITACLEGGRGASSDPHRDGVLAALADRQEELVRLEEEALHREQIAERFLSGIGDERCRVILRLRYMEMLRWNDVRSRMEELNLYYSERQVYNLHKKAVQLAEALFLERQNLPKGA